MPKLTPRSNAMPESRLTDQQIKRDYIRVIDRLEKPDLHFSEYTALGLSALILTLEARERGIEMEDSHA